MRSFTWFLVGFLGTVGLGCQGAHSPSTTGNTSSSSTQLNIVKTDSRDHLLQSSASLNSASNSNTAKPVSLSAEARTANTNLPAPQVAQVYRLTPDQASQDKATPSVNYPEKLNAGNAVEGMGVPPNPTILANTATLSGGTSLTLSQNSQALAPQSTTEKTDDAKTLSAIAQGTNLHLALNSPTGAAQPRLPAITTQLPKVPDGSKDLSNKNPSRFTLPPGPITLTPPPAPKKDKGTVVAKILPIFGNGGGNPVFTVHPGGIVQAPPGLGLLAPRTGFYYMLRFTKEAGDSPAVQVSQASLGGDPTKLPAGIIFQQDVLSPTPLACDASCDKLVVRVFYFGQLKNLPSKSQDALDIFSQMKKDPVSFWNSSVTASEQNPVLYWDFPILSNTQPIKSSNVSFDALPVKSTGIYFFLLKPVPADGNSSLSQGVIDNPEVFKNIVSETTDFLRALQLVSTNADQGGHGQ